MLLVPAAAVLLSSGCDTLVTEINNITVFDTTLGEACLECHTDSNDSLIVVPRGQWANSRHASSDLLEATVDLNGSLYNTAECGPVCHSGNGFVAFVESGSANVQTRPSVINCFTCHTPHTGTYGTWRLDLLRGHDTLGVTLNSGALYNAGRSNQCAICHQAPTLAIPSDTVRLAGDWGPHASPQADVLIGTAGFLVDSAAVAPSHRGTFGRDGCLDCHFGEGVGYSFGEHTFRLEDEQTGAQFVSNCNVAGCHQLARIDDFYTYSPAIDTLQALADSLETLLRGMGLLDPADTTGVRFIADTTISAGAARILYNYLVYRLDGSRGIHNPAYLDTLLRVSLAQWDSLPRADFTVFPSDPSLCAPLSVQFTDLSINATSWTWDFGDGSPVSNEQNPGHTYSARGTYTVTLTISGPGGTDVLRRDSAVTVKGTAAQFTGAPAIGCDSLTVTFINQSVDDIDSVRWDFGDLTQAVGDTVVHTYTAPGIYEVMLAAYGPCGADTTYDTIQVVSSPQGVDFTVTPTSGTAPLDITLTYTGPVNASFSFDWLVYNTTGDSLTTSGESVTLTLDSAGTYTVELTVTTPNSCSVTVTKPGIVTVTAPMPGGRPSETLLRRE